MTALQRPSGRFCPGFVGGPELGSGGSPRRQAGPGCRGPGFALVRESLMLYRSMGFRVAIDDLGEGFASLRLWSELRPAFVKADKHFVIGVAADPVKAQFLHAIQHIAENSGSLVIAEGIENAADFKIVKEMGV